MSTTPGQNGVIAGTTPANNTGTPNNQQGANSAPPSPVNPTHHAHSQHQHSPSPTNVVSTMANGSTVSATGSPLNTATISTSTPPSTPTQSNTATVASSTPQEPLPGIVNKYLLKLSSDSSKKQQNIKDEVKVVLEFLKTNPNVLAKPESFTSGPPGSLRVNNNLLVKFLNHLSIIYRFSFESKNNKLILASVEIIEKLISNGLILNNMYDDENAKLIIDKFIEPTLQHCPEISDEMTLLQIIKLVHIASTKFHRQTLLYSFKTMFYINIYSKPQSNLYNASKTSITQLINNLYKSFKIPTSGSNSSHSRSSSSVSSSSIASTSTSTASSNPSSKTSTPNLGRVHSAVSPPNLSGGFNHDISLSLPVELQSPTTANTTITVSSESTESSSSSSSTSSPSSESIIQDIIKEIIDKAVPTKLETDLNLDSIVEATASNSTKVNPTPSTPTNSNIPNTTTNATGVINDSDFQLKDSIYLFRFLCDLSLKDIPSDYYNDSVELKVRVYSLELLTNIFEKYGKFFKYYPNIVHYEIKEALYPSILNSGFCSNITVFKLSLTLFLFLIIHFSDYLREEVGQYFSLIILRILESSTSTLQQRWMVLQVLTHICDNSQILVDLYVNYDCSFQFKDIFQKIIENLSKIAQFVHSQDPKTHELKVKNAALDCLVTLLKALSESINQQKDQLSRFKSNNNNINSNNNNNNNTPGEEGTVNKYVKQKEFKLLIEQGKAKFKQSPKKGVDLLVKIGATEKTPGVLAKFFKETDGLDKAAIGEYISEKDEFNGEVRACYADLFNFSGFSLDAALRHFTSYFRLPGEAQKIDRIMESFAMKFYQDNDANNENPIFANTDATYLLAFAIVMLATDLHNPSIKNHMTKPAWLKMNSNNNDKKNFDESYLLGIYDRIAQEPLKLKDDFDEADLSKDEKLKIRNSFPIEDPPASKLVGLSKPPNYEHGVILDMITPMINCGWHSIIAALSLVLEKAEDTKVTQSCLDGFKYVIDLTSQISLTLEREAFISSLSNYAISDKIKELKQKNMDSLQKLILIARVDGNYLEKSWLAVFKAISLLERLRILLLGVNNPENTGSMLTIPTSSLTSSNSGSTTPTMTGLSSASSNLNTPNLTLSSQNLPMNSSSNSIPNTPVINSSSNFNTPSLTITSANPSILSTPEPPKIKKAVSTSDFFLVGKSYSSRSGLPNLMEGITIEQISKEIETANHLFVNSNNLSNDAIVYFVEQLTLISFEEIKLASPSTFSLQKLVEVAIYNSHRIKLIWHILSDHLTKIGTTDNVYISSMVIDSLKQLAHKFLDLEEQNKDSSQKDFLKPLESIYLSNSHPDIRELILKCIFQLTNGRNQMIKSGWRPIFTIFKESSSSHDINIATQAFDFVDELIRDFSYITESFFIDYVNCLSSFANSQFKDLSVRAIEVLNNCAVKLANGGVCALNREEGTLSTTPLFTDSEQHISLWFPLLTGLARVISHHDADLRSYSLDTLFRVLALFGSMFSAKLWELIFRGVLLPIFDNVGYYKGRTETIVEDTKWLKTTGNHAFQSLTEMFINFIDIICFLLDDMLDLLVSCILQENELLANTSGTFLIQLVSNNGNKFSPLQWSNIVSQFNKIFQSNTPIEVFKLLEENQQTKTENVESTLTSSLSAPNTPLVSSKSENNLVESENQTQENILSKSTSLPTSPISSSPNTLRKLNSSTSSLNSIDENNNSNEQTPQTPTELNSSTSATTEVAETTPIFKKITSKLLNLSTSYFNFNSQNQMNGNQNQNNSQIKILNVVKSKCSVQLQMVQAINDIAITHYKHLNTSQLLSMGECLNLTFSFCKEALKEDKLTIILRQISVNSTIDVLKQKSITGYLNLLFILYCEESEDAEVKTQQSEYRIIDMCSSLIQSFMSTSNSNPSSIDSNESFNILPETILQILKGILTLTDQKFLRCTTIMKSLIESLVLHPNRDVRATLRDILIRQCKLIKICDKEKFQ